MGARPLNRKIDELIRVPLSKKILFDRLQDCTINLGLDNDQLVFDIVPVLDSQLPKVDKDGYIIFEKLDPDA
jgi:hypothetical protein